MRLRLLSTAALVSLSVLAACVLPSAALRRDVGMPRASSVPNGTPAAHRLSWRTLPDAPTIRGKQDDLFFTSARLGWSVNGEGNIFRTRNGGDSWERVLHQPGTFFRAVVFVDSLNGFAGNIGTGYFPGVTDTIPLYRTRDGGTTWTPVTEIQGPYPKGVCNFSVAPDGRTIWASGRVGGPSFLLVSRDRGETWESQDVSDRLAMLIDVRFLSAERGLIIGGTSTDIRRSHSVVLTTEDGGRSWREAFRSRDATELAWKIDFPSARVGYISVLAYDSTSTFLKSLDGGGSWAEHRFISGPYQAKGVGFLSETTGWMAGERPGTPAYRTVDGGQTWQPDSTLGPLVNRFRFVRGRKGNLQAGYAIGMTIQKLDLQADR